MLTFIESILHVRTTNEKGKVATSIHNAVPGCYKNADRGLQNL